MINPTKRTKPYRPANATEGTFFEEDNCSLCERDRAYRETGGKSGSCPIVALVMVHAISDGEYPKQWVQDEDGKNPRCTDFVPEGKEVPYRCPHTLDMFAEARA
jgi:hypothetical protein